MKFNDEVRVLDVKQTNELHRYLIGAIGSVVEVYYTGNEPDTALVAFASDSGYINVRNINVGHLEVVFNNKKATIKHRKKVSKQIELEQSIKNVIED